MTGTAGRKKAAFLDRDGVINIDHGYVGHWRDFEFVSGAVDAMRTLHEAGYVLVVVTNQSGIARGKYSEADFLALSVQMRASLQAQGVPLAAIEYCPHLPDGQVPEFTRDCDCRKPAPGMLLRAAEALQLDLPASLMFGDKVSDMEAAVAAGVGRCVLLAKNGEGESARSPAHLTALRFVSLAEAVPALVQPAG
ncbi:D-glycero-beta-D-manno-heptose 1,7-bisphosphate 7-phosphatase [Roseateles koreensis]|uniref:D,D-heptose 1,7-bisphosphate phosphatase n=1 Tax=Roseateles koreensis TaxID=2987526 RepID=A0ABT5KVI9_9BURK|nr:D-glycero-beta-D-manno-heptose 1,7-bisphosphate 7-phosphatase [Roseateles koreensis]MDC8786956.1 D-glycero-beta-D-manno-heptose 1,7-bisphosphate 7-phosphatase [Roseateles koreensis]